MRDPQCPGRQDCMCDEDLSCDPPGGTLRGVPSGAELIAAERQRQIDAEGWTPEHDDHHDDNGLAWAARCYIDAATIPDDQWPSINRPPLNWPWAQGDWKPSRGEDRVRDLTKAGALIAAEIDRIQRQADA